MNGSSKRCKGFIKFIEAEKRVSVSWVVREREHSTYTIMAIICTWEQKMSSLIDMSQNEEKLPLLHTALCWLGQNASILSQNLRRGILEKRKN